MLLPDTALLNQVRSHPGAAPPSSWSERIAAFRRDGLEVIDLMPVMRAIPADSLDRGYDGTHYGPKTNKIIGEAVGRKLSELGWF